MPTHTERRPVPFKATDMFELVGDVERYPDFLPWCSGARIRKTQITDEGKVITADLIIAYKMFRERFTSEVVLKPEELLVEVTYKDGPFKYLESYWKMIPTSGGSDVDFHVNFEFKSRMLQSMIARIFTKAVEKMVAAFIARAEVQYEKVATPDLAAPPSGIPDKSPPDENREGSSVVSEVSSQADAESDQKPPQPS